jgi:tetratricopeptide (TPR) repeat protein
MSSDTLMKEHRSRALELANFGISSGADGEHETAQDAWRKALVYAEQHLSGDNIIPWIRSGLGDALLECGDFRGALEMSSTALAFCGSAQAPLASLTMAKAYLRLGDVPRARDCARQACQLRSEAVLKQFSPADRDTLGQLGLSHDKA